MRALLKDGLIVLIAETDSEASSLADWSLSHQGHVLHVRTDGHGNGRSIVLHDLGERDEACREPVNIVSNSADPVARTISNFADAPFELDGKRYRTVESFWQGLKFSSQLDRARVAQMDGPQARHAGEQQGYPAKIEHAGREIVPGTWDHWRLMEAACRAKFEQCSEARAALLATGNRPLTHVVRRDSRTIPGVVMAEIWIRIRRRLRRDLEAGPSRPNAGRARQAARS